MCREREHAVKRMWQILKTDEFWQRVYIFLLYWSSNFYICVKHFKIKLQNQRTKKSSEAREHKQEPPSGWMALPHVCPRAGFTNNSHLLWQMSLWPCWRRLDIFRAIRSFTRISGLIWILLIGEITKKGQIKHKADDAAGKRTSHSRHKLGEVVGVADWHYAQETQKRPFLLI